METIKDKENQTFKFKTNIKCSGCLTKIAPVLNHINEVKEWNVDLESSNKVLTVISNGLKTEDVIQKIKDTGYDAIEIL